MIKLFFLPHQLNLYTSYFLNSTVAIKNAEEEIALTLKGKKSNLKAADFIVTKSNGLYNMEDMFK